MAEAIAYRFDHIHLYCSDLAATEQWFLDGLGADLVARRDSAAGPSSVLRLGGAELLLRPARPGETLAAPGPRAFGTDHFGLAVPDLDAAAAELKRRGVYFEVEPRDLSSSLRIAYVRGPDNIRIELVQHLT